MPERSYLNIIDIDSSREVRAAEFGFCAKKPSFCRIGDSECIMFDRDNKKYLFSLNDGSISEPRSEVTYPALPSSAEIKLQALSDSGDTVYYALTLRRSDDEVILCRFMGTADSIGEHPLSFDGKRVVFIGYPNPKGLDTPE